MDIEDSSRLGLKYAYRIDSDIEAPLVFLVHGKAGDYKVMWIFERVIAKDYNIIAPQAPLEDSRGGFSWWLKNNEENRLVACQSLENFVASALSHYGLKPKKIIALGFSQGGAVLSIMSQRQVHFFDSIAMLASFYIKYDQTIGTYPRFFIGHGKQDEVVPFEKALETKDYLEAKHVDLTFVEDDVGHKIGVNAMRQLKDWL